MLPRLIVVSAALHVGTALRLGPVHAEAAAKQQLGQTAKTAVVAALCSAQLLAAPAFAVPPTLQEAIIETSEAAYPVLKVLPADSFPAFATKIGDLFLGFKPDKLSKSIDLGVDLFLSVPEADLTTFNGVVKDAFDGLKPDSCDLVPLPPPSLVQKFTSSVGFAGADAGKLKAFDEKWGPTLKALAKTDDGAKICLPAAEKLDKLAIAQAKLAKSFGADEAKAFGTYFGGVAKASIQPGKVFPLVGEAQKQTMGADLKARQRLKTAGATLETVSKTCAALPKRDVCQF